MTIEQLDAANKIKAEIKKLESFIWTAERTWTGSLISKEVKMIFKSHSYGAMKSGEYEMDTETKNLMLEVLRGKLKKLYTELEAI